MSDDDLFAGNESESTDDLLAMQKKPAAKQKVSRKKDDSDCGLFDSDSEDEAARKQVVSKRKKLEALVAKRKKGPEYASSKRRRHAVDSEAAERRSNRNRNNQTTAPDPHNKDWVAEVEYLKRTHNVDLYYWDRSIGRPLQEDDKLEPGIYDIIFCVGDFSSTEYEGGRVSRTATGTLELESVAPPVPRAGRSYTDDTALDGYLELRGKAMLDTSFRGPGRVDNYEAHLQFSYAFALVRSEGSLRTTELGFIYNTHGTVDYELAYFDDFHDDSVRFEIVQRPATLHWDPDESGNDVPSLTASEILDAWESEHLWFYQHFDLPDRLAKLVQSFVHFQPEPTFRILPGDLLIRMEALLYTTSYDQTYVARRRPQQQV